jgi:hypothetical protein
MLVIADHACGRELRSIARAHSERPTHVRVLAPTEARARLDETVAALRSSGIDADGRLAADDPLRAADDELADFAADELLFALGVANRRDPGGDDVVARARLRYEIPVIDLG